MIEINHNANIPIFAVSDAVEMLHRLYSGAVNKGISFKELATPMLWGSAGVGKSQGVAQLAKKLEETTGKKTIITDVRLLLFNPIDLRGIPTHNNDRTESVWLKPKIFCMDDSDDVINILLLDEISAAPQTVQAAAYQMCLDRKIGEHRLPENCIVIAAGNRTTDKSVSFTMPKALCNRLMHLLIESDFDSWRRWALRNDIDSRIIGYLSFDRSRLCVEVGSGDMAFATPRSWSFVNSVIKTIGEEPEELHRLIAGCIGVDSAVEFEHWCKAHGQLPDIEDILLGRCTTYPKSQDALFAVSASLITEIYKRHKNVSCAELENVCGYAKRFPADFAMSFFKDLASIDEIKLKLMKCGSMQSWLNDNKKYL